LVAEVDISSAYNDFGGLFNAPNYPNGNAFATLKADGSITAWGDSEYGGADTPDGNALEISTSAKRHFSTVLSTVFCQ
jgi:hypothetical protein